MNRFLTWVYLWNWPGLLRWVILTALIALLGWHVQRSRESHAHDPPPPLEFRKSDSSNP